METITIPGTDMAVSRIALGTWAIGGWMWGGTDEKASIDTIHAALDKGVNLIDTAPVYGFGRSEEIVGRAVKQYGRRDRIHISTKAGLEWKDDQVFRNAAPSRIAQEVEASLRRLQTDVIDLYFIHWPDPKVPFEETARLVESLKDQGKIRACGVSNFSPEQMDAFRRAADLQLCQPPYNMFERGIEGDVLPYCKAHDIALMTYGALCRGLLSGKMTPDREFPGDDLRNHDPKFRSPRFGHYLMAAARLKQLARDTYQRRLLAAAVRWVLDMGVDIAIWGGRRPEQMDPIEDVTGWKIDKAFKLAVDEILLETIPDPVGPDFMAPPAR
jgi:aryl-alcohol dehydrogenase-like predicted oxidoreductase